MRKGMVRVHRVINLNAQVLRKWRDIARGPNGCRYLSMNIQEFSFRKQLPLWRVVSLEILQNPVHLSDFAVKCSTRMPFILIQ